MSNPISFISKIKNLQTSLEIFFESFKSHFELRANPYIAGKFIRCYGGSFSSEKPCLRVYNVVNYSDGNKEVLSQTLLAFYRCNNLGGDSVLAITRLILYEPSTPPIFKKELLWRL